MSLQLRSPQQSEKLLYKELVRAARAGEACPSNSKLCTVLGATSVATPSRLMSRLASRKRIVVKAYANGREVYLPEVGLTIISAAATRSLTRQAAAPPPAPIAQPGQVVRRDPCFRCGVRGDIGCEHQSAEML